VRCGSAKGCEDGSKSIKLPSRQTGSRLIRQIGATGAAGSIGPDKRSIHYARNEADSLPEP
jgi:hypothetical protein